MVGAIILLFYGVVLIFLGTKYFWAFFFIGLGTYIFYTYYSAFKRKKIQKKILEKSIIKLIKENNPETAAHIIAEKIKYPIGTKFVINVNSVDTNVKLVFPLGILISMKPILYTLKPFLKEALKSNFSKKGIKIDFDFNIIINMIIETIDYLSEFYGEFIDVETDEGKTKIKIYVA
ncbi:hypothetical protein X275_10120 [Marinitoga sp. 1197]|uniref:hypothetical protein n=1 Tax=Marinitoga sp. 1197 TaxID=1428449 RepID=UPI0006413680|nr:hypothetical protein [Marinitoga sp. 1197]KLO21101.1 hypothetical protein X275_10120 [Marinitoga sp. 1197]